MSDSTPDPNAMPDSRQLPMSQRVINAWQSPKATEISEQNLEQRKQIERALKEGTTIFEVKYKCDVCGTTFAHGHSTGALSGNLVSGAMRCPKCGGPAFVTSMPRDYCMDVKHN